MNDDKATKAWRGQSEMDTAQQIKEIDVEKYCLRAYPAYYCKVDPKDDTIYYYAWGMNITSEHKDILYLW